MKKKTILALAVLAVTFGLTACSSQNDETDQLKEQVAQLEQQVEDLQKESPDSSIQDVSTPPTSESDEPTLTENTSAQDTTQKSAANTPDMSVLSELIQDLEQRIKDTTPTGSDQEQREQFYTLKEEIDSVERELDALEDNLEAQYHSGSLDVSAYREQEREVEALEDQLDRCEDQLELIFGIDD